MFVSKNRTEEMISFLTKDKRNKIQPFNYGTTFSPSVRDAPQSTQYELLQLQ